MSTTKDYEDDEGFKRIRLEQVRQRILAEERAKKRRETDRALRELFERDIDPENPDGEPK